MDNILPVQSIEVIIEAASGAQCHGEPGDGGLQLDDILGEADLIYLGEVFMLDYWQSVPVYLWFSKM